MRHGSKGTRPNISILEKLKNGESFIVKYPFRRLFGL